MVIEKVAALLGSPQRRRARGIAINVSALSVTDPAMLALPRAPPASATGSTPRSWSIEITETAAISDMDSATSFLRRRARARLRGRAR